MNIQLHIEQLILDGMAVPFGQHAGLQAAVEAELARLLLTGGLNAELRSGGALPWLRGGQVIVGQENSPTHLGTQIASAVYSGIGDTEHTR